jgi:broad specificity phosphatase PhoE
MSNLRRLILVRHGETDGESSIRFHGATDVSLSEVGRQQMRLTSRKIGTEVFDLVAASPLRRSWASAWIVGRGAHVSLLPEFREVDFGRWEGLTREEIEARDPVTYADWQAAAEAFEYPGGEARAAFRARVGAGFEKLQASGAHAPLVVVHKGVIRALVALLTGEELDRETPELGGIVEVTRGADDKWFVGTRGSDPAALAEEA